MARVTEIKEEINTIFKISYGTGTCSTSNLGMVPGISFNLRNAWQKPLALSFPKVKDRCIIEHISWVDRVGHKHL